jgi:hypothetical protein
MGKYGQFHDATYLAEGKRSEYIFVIYDKKNSERKKLFSYPITFTAF